MATSVVAGDIVVSQVVCYSTAEQQSAVLNRYWYVFSVTGGSVTFGQIATQLDTNWNAQYLAMMPNVASYRGTRVRRVFPVVPAMAQWEAEIGNAGNGSEGSIGLPTQTCLLIQLYTDFVGKKAQGRQYVPFISSNFVTSTGIPNSAAITAGLLIAAELTSPVTVTAGGGSAVIVPILFNPVVPSTVYQLKRADVPPAFATQKRRGLFGRTNKVPF